MGHIGTYRAGSPADVLTHVTVLLYQCEDLADVEGLFPRITNNLKFTLRRVEWVHRQGGHSREIAGAMRWLDQVVRDLPALDSDGGEPIRAELRRLTARIAEHAGL
jgi:hypothetical protein